jgi:hypothetical protein
MAGDTGLYNLSEHAGECLMQTPYRLWTEITMVGKILQCSNGKLAAFIIFRLLITALALNFTRPEINKKFKV